MTILSEATKHNAVTSKLCSAFFFFFNFVSLPLRLMDFKINLLQSGVQPLQMDYSHFSFAMNTY